MRFAGLRLPQICARTGCIPYAKHRKAQGMDGGSHVAVHKAIRTGRITTTDRLILMTDGPEARIGDILSLPFPRPRDRAVLVEHPGYYSYRSRIIDFLENHAQQRNH